MVNCNWMKITLAALEENFIYFITLFIGYLLIKKNIFLITALLLLFHLLFVNKENFENKKEKSDKNWESAQNRSNERNKDDRDYPDPDMDEAEQKKLGEKNEKHRNKDKYKLESENHIFK